MSISAVPPISASWPEKNSRHLPLVGHRDRKLAVLVREIGDDEYDVSRVVPAMVGHGLLLRQDGVQGNVRSSQGVALPAQGRETLVMLVKSAAAGRAKVFPVDEVVVHVLRRVLAHGLAVVEHRLADGGEQNGRAQGALAPGGLVVGAGLLCLQNDPLLVVALQVVDHARGPITVALAGRVERPDAPLELLRPVAADLALAQQGLERIADPLTQVAVLAELLRAGVA